MNVKCVTKVINHRNGDTTAKCCDCGKKQRHPHYEWSRAMTGGDAYALQCPSCNAKELETGEK